MVSPSRVDCGNSGRHWCVAGLVVVASLGCITNGLVRWGLDLVLMTAISAIEIGRPAKDRMVPQ
ncbi:MAG: hypothetical protein KGQ60_16090, partial [Planctomycetes bacterium]|nr:hypothetical protein [Planctomycetota bacterium]